MPLIVNGQPIDDEVLDAEFANVKSFFERQGNISCCERDEEFKGYARQNVIARLLLAEEAARRTAAPSAEEMEAGLRRMKLENGGEAQFDAMVNLVPGQLDAVRRDVEASLRVERMIADLCAGDPDPTDDEVRAYYDQHLPAFTSEEQVRASHISKNPGRGESRQSVYEALREVRRQLLAGADFDELARQHSDKGQELIDLNFYKRGEFPEEFELVTFSMEVGELSPIFASTYGLHIAKVTGRHPPAPMPFEAARDEARRRVIDERRQAKVRELAQSLQAKATIEDVPTETPADAPA